MKINFPPFSVILAFVCLAVMGYALLPLLSIQWLPSAKERSLTVWCRWAGASPEVMEQEVITPLEGAFGLVEGVKRVYSIARSGSGTIAIDIAPDIDIDFFRFELASKVRQLYPKFPNGVNFPTISINDPEQELAERPILSYALSGNATPSELYQYAKETLSPKLALLKDLERIEVAGGNATEFQIVYQSARLAQLGLSATDLLQALSAAYRIEDLGIVDDNQDRINIRLNNTGYDIGDETSLVKKQLLDIPIKKIGGKVIRLEELASISFEERPATQFYRINGENSIRLLFYASAGSNTIQMARDVKNNILTLSQNLPLSYKLLLEDDATVFLTQELNKIGQRTLLSLGILLLFTLLIYRSWRYLMIVIVSIFCNLGLAFILYYLFRIELHLYALAGVTISFGMMIDNSIVMMHHLRKHNNLYVFPALLASTLTTIAALVVIWFLPKQWQVNLLALAQVISINLAISLLVALLLIPALMGYFYDDQPTPKSHKKFLYQKKLHYWYSRLLALLIRRKGIAIVGLILLFGLPIFLLPNTISGWDWYNKTLGNEWYTENVKPTANKLLGGTLRLFLWYVYEGSSYRETGETVLYVRASMPTGSTVAQLNTVFQQVEGYLGNYKTEVKQFTSQIYSGQNGSLEIYFNKGYDLIFPHQLKSRLTAFSLNLGGIKWNIYGVGKGFSNDSGSSPPSFRVMMSGYNKSQLETQAERFAEKLLAHPRIQEVNVEANINWWEKDIYEYELAVFPTEMVAKGINKAQLFNVLEDFNQLTYPDFYLPNQQAVRLINDQTPKNNLWLLNHKTQTSDSLKFAFPTIAQLTKQKVRSSIHKENQAYIRMVEFQYTGSARFGQKYLDEIIGQMRKEMPLGYTLEQNTWSWGKEDKKQYALLGLVIVLIFMISAIMFESFKQAFSILVLIPISFIGIFLTFYWSDFPFDQGGYTSFILLSGIVVNSLILIINDFNYYKKRRPQSDSLGLYIKAFYQKAIPIFLTIVSTILGLIPFLMYGQNEVFWFSLAIGTIGGLLFSFLVIGLFIPVFFVAKPSYKSHLPTKGESTKQ